MNASNTIGGVMRGITQLFFLTVAIGLALRAEAQPTSMVRGRLVTSQGKPLANVPVTPLEVMDGWGISTSTVGFENLPLFSDTNGEFTLRRAQAFSQVQVKIKAEGMAQALVWLQSTPQLQEIKIVGGAALRGRVVMADKHLLHLQVELSRQEEGGNWETRQTETASNGVFNFEHLPPDQEWKLLGGTPTSSGRYGTFGPISVQTPSDGETNDLGEVKGNQGLRLAGQIKTRNGEALPAYLEVYLSSFTGYIADSRSAPVDAAGHFEFEGVKAGEVTLSLSPHDWRLTGANRSLALTSANLVGNLTEDKTNLILEIDRQRSDPARNNSYQQNFFASGLYFPGMPGMPQHRPLSGAEAGGPPDTVLAGRVVDDQTGQPIQLFQVTPGRVVPLPSATNSKPLLQRLMEPFADPAKMATSFTLWEGQLQETYSNGVFSVGLEPWNTKLVLQFEAPGYLPMNTEALLDSKTNLVLRMKRGVGPHGVVLSPDGKPVANASVGYATRSDNFDVLNGQLSDFQSNQSLLRTGSDGKFSFAPRLDGAAILVTHRTGWGLQSVAPGEGGSLQIRLKPWATVTGTLVDTNGAAVAGTQIMLNLARSEARVGIFVASEKTATTDSRGRFTFQNVPPGRLEIHRMAPMKTGLGANFALQTWLVAEPGVTNDVGRVTVDQPPPEPIWDQVKAKLGL